MNDTIRRISWRDLFPWLILLRTFRIAISPPLLALATAAVLIAPLGWRLAALVFRPQFLEQPLAASLPPDAPQSVRDLVQQQQIRSFREAIPGSDHSLLARWLPPAVREYLPSAQTAILEAYYDLAEPVARLFQLRTTIRETAYYTFGFLWTLSIWAFPGGLITRRAIVQLATDSPPDLLEAARLAGSRWHWYFVAPLYPLLPVFGLAAL